MGSKLENGVWTVPVAALPSFANENFEPRVTPDGKKLFFMVFGDASGQERPPINMFCAERTGNGWGEVYQMGEPFNPGKSMFISVTDDGTIYTTDAAKLDVVCSRLQDGKYQAYENPGAPVNTDGPEVYPYIAPDESYVLYNLMGPDDRPLKVSFRGEDGSWSEPKDINTGMQSGCATVSPDGKYLFFVSGPPRKGDLYWVDMKVVHDLKSTEHE